MFPQIKNLLISVKSKKMILVWIIIALSAVTGLLNFLTPSKTVAIANVVLVMLISFVLAISHSRSISLKNSHDFAEGQLQSLIRALPDGILIYDPSFKIIFINAAAEKVLSVKKEDVSGLRVSPDLAQDPRFKILAQIIFPSLAPTVIQISQGGWPQVTDISFDNPQLELRTILTKVLNENGAPAGFLKIIMNKTREKTLLASKKEFLDTSAHELRTPLNAISWAFESIIHDAENPEIKSVAKDGLDLAHRSLATVENLLTASQIESGKFGYSFRETEIVGFLEEIINHAKMIAKKAGVSVNFNAPPQTSQKLFIDPQRLAIAFSSLIDNAIKYNTKNGIVTIHLLNPEESPDIKIIIEDSGIGIPEAEIKNIFQKFYRASNITNIAPNGSGLGLYITRNIIKNHGGEIMINSTEGRGTTVTITLPKDPNRVPREEISYDTE